ncbi:peptide ABC transporter permease [Pseudoclavibacter endophyticus]|uniref:ABC transporter permease n=1 Tax=Pseudoclavibacter endophyticus TaxID=1778590 RepID=A0A6H9WJV7_9MICO|nr:ABC transporter permease [Pseudoclavibacter endophyticus]KAB1649136.1 ABC transporter permease [Pseudoclavibacter endophyticus]GGA65120.1 peptide ABC transporter permease [Pseudoclavibacter endophyticus]
MLRFLLKKLPAVLIVIAATSIIAFLLPRLAPGDPATALAGADATPEQIEAIRQATGLDQPLVVQYFDWIGGVFRGDLGQSYLFNTSVGELILSRLESTLELAALAAIIMIAIGLLLGTLSGSPRSRVSRSILDVINTVMLATPPFLTGLLLILVFGIYWRLLPVSGEVGLIEDPNAGIQYLILPAIALALPQAAVVARLLQTSMLNVRGEDFVDLARAKGASPRRITYRHVLRNSLGATVVVIGLRIGELLGGAIVIEAIFARNGLGQLAVASVQDRDYFVVQALILGAVVIAVAIQLFTEIILAALDPRIRLEA